MIESESERRALRIILSIFTVKILGKISQVNALFSQGEIGPTTEDIELAALYIIQENFIAEFKTYMEEIDNTDTRYSMSGARFRMVEKYIKKAVGRDGFDRDFTVTFDHVSHFLIQHLASLQKRHPYGFTTLFSDMVLTSS